MKTQIPLKELPPQPKKGKIYEMYGRQFSSETIRENLKTIIDDFKEKTGMKVNSRDVPKAVWIEFISIFGFPPGYEQKPEWLEEPTIFNRK